MAYTGGSDLNQLGDKTRMRVITERFTNPRALDVDFFVTSVDPSGLTAGTALTLTAASSGLMLRHPRRATISITDASYSAGTPLTVTVRIIGQRMGRRVVEDLAAVATSGSVLTVTSDALFDEITSATPILLTNTASGDALTVGLAGAALGLKYRIRSVSDVLLICNVASGTEQTATAISATTVDVDQSCVQGLTLAATDDWTVKYIAREDDGFGSTGVFP